MQVGRSTHNVTIDAIGPKTYTFRDLVEEIGHAVGRSPQIVSIPPVAMWAPLVGALPQHLEENLAVALQLDRAYAVHGEQPLLGLGSQDGHLSQ